MALPLDLDRSREGVVIGLRVSPASSRDRLVGALGGRLKISVREAPERGKANRAALRMLARALNLPRTDLEILRGAGSASKRVLIRGLTDREILSRLEEVLS